MPRLLAVAAAALAVAGCATPRLDGQWADPAFAQRTLRDQLVLVSCRGPDGTLARLCEDRLAGALREAGARPVRAPQPLDPAAGGAVIAAAAREAGASAAVASSISVAAVAQAVPTGPRMGMGVGGGFGSGGFSGGGISLSMSVPIGGARPQTALASSTAVLDAASGAEMWSARATSPSSEDASVQVAGLARTSVDAMRRSGLFDAR
jgi:hypothetical protein